MANDCKNVSEINAMREKMNDNGTREIRKDKGKKYYIIQVIKIKMKK